MDVIKVSGLRELGIHGVLPEEQLHPQPFEVDVELHLDLGPAGSTDDLTQTVDYGAVCESVARVISSEQYRLLERLADRIAEVCCADARVERAIVEVRKLKPPVRAMLDSVGVRIERAREHG